MQSKKVPRGPSGGPGEAQVSDFHAISMLFLKGVRGLTCSGLQRLKAVPEASKIGPRWHLRLPRWPQNEPRGPQDGPVRAPIRPKRFPRQPQSALGRLQERPERLARRPLKVSDGLRKF